MSSTKMPRVELCEISSENWRDVAGLQVRSDQQQYVADPTYYLCLCNYGKLWNPLAICLGDDVVGFMMWAIDPDDGSCWLGGILIDRVHQGKGIGRASVLAAIEKLQGRCQGQFALSYSPDNERARHLYTSIGFAETGEHEDLECVARLGKPID